MIVSLYRTVVSTSISEKAKVESPSTHTTRFSGTSCLPYNAAAISKLSPT